ncbi:hypothetical protein BDR04DRAFT_1086748 [Suillus decipiens]|nr:hypothetical protein BDR04DRAFT_1086748 [Suillus decipiens]
MKKLIPPLSSQRKFVIVLSLALYIDFFIRKLPLMVGQLKNPIEPPILHNQRPLVRLGSLHVSEPIADDVPVTLQGSILRNLVCRSVSHCSSQEVHLKTI